MQHWNTKKFCRYANKSIERITSLYVPITDVIQESDGIKNAPKIPNTLEIHKIERVFDAAKVCLVAFYYLASDTKSFHIQKYSGLIYFMPLVSFDNP